MRKFHGLVVVEAVVVMFCTTGFAAMVKPDTALPIPGKTIQTSPADFDGVNCDSASTQSSQLPSLSSRDASSDPIPRVGLSSADYLATLPFTATFKYSAPLSLTTSAPVACATGKPMSDDPILSTAIAGGSNAAASVNDQPSQSTDLTLNDHVQIDVGEALNISMPMGSQDSGSTRGLSESEMVGSLFKPSAIGILGLAGLALLHLRRQPI